MFNMIDSWLQIPQSVKSFIGKILILFLVWEFIYLGWLLPLRIPDRQITNITAVGTSYLLSIFFPGLSFGCQSVFEGFPGSFKTIVLVNGTKLIGIADGCNGFELQVLYAGILICLQKTNPRTLWYLLIGIPLISFGNIFRCSLIGFLNITQHIRLSVYAHHYVFKMMMYSLIFFGWVSYVNPKKEQ